MTFAIIAAIAVLMSLALWAVARPEPRRIPVRIRDQEPRGPWDRPRLPPR